MEEGPGLMRHVALSLLTLVGWPLSFALLISTTLLSVHNGGLGVGAGFALKNIQW